MHLYEVSFTNKGGLVMPIIVQFKFDDSTTETEKIPAQIWRHNENNVSKVFLTTKNVVSIQLDPMRETADIDESNNYWGEIPQASKFAIFKANAPNLRNPEATQKNPMQLSNEQKKK